jgi:hypothetical protein
MNNKYYKIGDYPNNEIFSTTDNQFKFQLLKQPKQFGFDNTKYRCTLILYDFAGIELLRLEGSEIEFTSLLNVLYDFENYCGMYNINTVYFPMNNNFNRYGINISLNDIDTEGPSDEDDYIIISIFQENINSTNDVTARYMIKTDFLFIEELGFRIYTLLEDVIDDIPFTYYSGE